MLSNASKYAIRSVLFLAEKSSVNNKYGYKQIADELEIPSSFIAKLLQKLVKAGIISSNKGPKGGFFMTAANLKNNINSILKEIESEDIFEDCFLGLARCNDENPCPVHHIVDPLKKALLEKFTKQTIKEFSEEIKENASLLSLKGIKFNDKDLI